MHSTPPGRLTHGSAPKYSTRGKKTHEDKNLKKKSFFLFFQGLGVGSAVWNLNCLEHEYLLKDLKGTGLHLEKFKK